MASANGCEARHGLPILLHEFKEHVLWPRPDLPFCGLVDHQDDVGVGFQHRLADNLVDASLVVPIFHRFAFLTVDPITFLRKRCDLFAHLPDSDGDHLERMQYHFYALHREHRVELSIKEDEYPIQRIAPRQG